MSQTLSEGTGEDTEAPPGLGFTLDLSHILVLQLCTLKAMEKPLWLVTGVPELSQKLGLDPPQQEGQAPRSEKLWILSSHPPPNPEVHEVQPKILFKDDFPFQCVSIREGGG